MTSISETGDCQNNDSVLIKRGWNSLPEARLGWWPDFISEAERALLWEQVLKQVELEQGHVTLYGKRHLIPRLQAWYGPEGYTYSGETLPAKTIPPILMELLERCEQQAEAQFNSVLVNYYRDGLDKMGWHSDDEPELGYQPVIASLSLGAERDFDLKHKHSGEKIRIGTSDGSLLIMAGACQHFWQHAVPKRTKLHQPRINLTFRYIYPTN